MLVEGVGDHDGETGTVGGVGEVAPGEALDIVLLQMGKVLANETLIRRTRARLEEKGLRGEEACPHGSGARSHLVDGGFTVGDAGKQGRAEDAGGEACGTQRSHRFEAEVGAGCAGFKDSGERSVGRSDGDVDDESIAAGDLAQQVDVADDQLGFGVIRAQRSTGW
jgi:hypothetical protein